jgi:cytoskeletal protein CcmA (bactofilin family)
VLGHSATEPPAQTDIGNAVVIKGQIFTREDLTIDGEIDGFVEVHEHCLTVGQTGRVRAQVKAHEVVLLGTIHGDVEAADKIDIRKGAELVGDIKAARILLEDGVNFKGSMDITPRSQDAMPAAELRSAASGGT